MEIVGIKAAESLYLRRGPLVSCCVTAAHGGEPNQSALSLVQRHSHMSGSRLWRHGSRNTSATRGTRTDATRRWAGSAASSVLRLAAASHHTGTP